MNGLAGRISSTQIPPSVRRAIISGFFRVNLSPAESQSLDPYFNDWYEDQCNAVYQDTSIQTHQQIIDLVSLLQQDGHRPDIVAAMAAASEATEPVNESINLAARLWLTVSIGSLQHAFNPGSTVSWNDGKLSDTLQVAFQYKNQLSDTVKLPKSFNAANLERIAGIEIVWTSNLADHLSLKDDDSKMMVYHHASFLDLHKLSKTSIIPDDLIDETLLTLALLLPSSDAKVQTWLRKKQKELCLDPNAGTYGPLNSAARQIENFHYWRDRLVILKQAFDESEPRSISIWWHDDRKKVQWYTFWVAALVLVLTIVFGIITSVSGVVQAWASVRAMSAATA